MSKKKVNSSKNSKATKNVASMRNRRNGSSRQPGMSYGGPLSHPALQKWDRLLRDPCGADLCNAPYAGVASGYLIRTVDVYPIVITGLTGLTFGAIYPADVHFQWSPWNASQSTGIVYGAGQASGAFTYFSKGFSNFVTTATGAVKHYRPIASCLKYVPNGPYATRQGTHVSGYSPGLAFTTSDTASDTNIVSLSQRTVAVGSDCHEVRWLPTAVDENWTTITDTNSRNVGSIFMGLLNVDATASSATTLSVNGYIEVVTAWEWTPSTNTSQASITPRAPLPYTTNQLLSTIGDLGAYIFEGVRTGGVMGGIINGGQRAIQRMLTGGVSMQTNRGSAMPIAY